jgi:hypothetical protein
MAMQKTAALPAASRAQVQPFPDLLAWHDTCLTALP